MLRPPRITKGWLTDALASAGDDQAEVDEIRSLLLEKGWCQEDLDSRGIALWLDTSVEVNVDDSQISTCGGLPEASDEEVEEAMEHIVTGTDETGVCIACGAQGDVTQDSICSECIELVS